jgi:hypothetical protein
VACKYLFSSFDPRFQNVAEPWATHSFRNMLLFDIQDVDIKQGDQFQSRILLIKLCIPLKVTSM